MRGFLDLLTVTFMGRYRQRPLHLFGGLGLLLGAVGTAVLVYLTMLKMTGRGDRPPAAADARRPARRRRRPARLARPRQRADHEPPRGAERRAGRGAARGRDPAAEPDGSLLRDVRARLSAQRAGDLVPAPRRRRGGGTARRGLGAGSAKLGRERRDRSASGGGGGAGSSRGGRAAASTPSSSATRVTSTCPRRSAPRAGDRCSSTRSSRCTRRSSRTGGRFAPRIGRGTGAASDRPRRASRRRPRRRGHCGERAAPGRARRSAAGPVATCFVGAEERLFRPPGSRGALPCALRRQADSAARPRDDPRGGPARAGDLLSHRRQRPARPAPRRAAGERRVDRLGRLRAASPAELAARGLRARDLRHLSEGGARDPEQGVPGARLRRAARHRRHAGGPRAPAGRRERPARPAGDADGAGGRGATPRSRARPRRPHRRRRARRLSGARERGRARPSLARARRARACA